MLYACDLKWWRASRPGPDDAAPGLRVSQCPDACAVYGLQHVLSRPEPGLCMEPDVIHQGLNSGYQAINLAVHLGARRILLLGYDMQRTNGLNHWFGDHPRGLQVRSPYKMFAEQFGPLAQDARHHGIDIVNCSRETALQCFPRSTITKEMKCVIHPRS